MCREEEPERGRTLDCTSTLSGLRCTHSTHSTQNTHTMHNAHNAHNTQHAQPLFLVLSSVSSPRLCVHAGVSPHDGGPRPRPSLSLYLALLHGASKVLQVGPDKVERDGAGGEGETPSDHPRHRVQRLVLVVRGRVAAVGDHRRHVWARGACERAVDFVAPRERGERGSRNSTVRASRGTSKR